MRKLMGGIVGVFFCATSVFAADAITIDLGGTPAILAITAPRKANIDKLLARVNLRRATQTPPLAPMTREQFVQMLFVTSFQQYDLEAVALSTAGDADFCTIFLDNAQTTATQRNQVISVGKGASPCP